MNKMIWALLSLTVTSSVLAASNVKSREWLNLNALKEGVITLPSGLQYKVIKSGSGILKPTINIPCVCHYNGTLIDRTNFDSSYNRRSPVTFTPNQVIAGWTEALQMMVGGDKWELFIPSEIGYGDQGNPPKIGPGDALVFTLELLEVKEEQKNPEYNCEPSTLENCTAREIEYTQMAKKMYPHADNLEDEIQVIEKLHSTYKNNSLKEWAKRRLHILKKRMEVLAEKDEL